MRPVNPNMARTFAPPVMEARRWLDGVEFPPDRPLLNLSQAAPVDPPPPAMRAAMAAMMERPEVHLYGPVLGLPALREEVAGRTARIYGGEVGAAQVAITSGCNEAFCAVIATLAAPGEPVVLPVPWYFNHKMALDMGGQIAVPLATGGDLIPDPDRAARDVPTGTRAIVLISPNNPAGVEYPPEILRDFVALARERGAALILDETYRDFHSADGPPHDLFTDPDWDDTLIHLYSFSKAYRLTGHRVGAIVASEARLAQVEKYLDTVTICPAQLGQHAALWGMRNLDGWLAGERAEILARRDAMVAGMTALPGWTLRGCGAYFAYVDHPYDAPSDAVARRLVRDAGILALPGTMFRPRGEAGGDAAILAAAVAAAAVAGAEGQGASGSASGSAGGREMRLAFANLDADGIGTVIDRLRRDGQDRGER